MSAQEAPVTWQSITGDPDGNALTQQYGAVLERIDNALVRLSEDVASLRSEQVIGNARLLALFQALS